MVSGRKLATFFEKVVPEASGIILWTKGQERPSNNPPSPPAGGEGRGEGGISFQPLTLTLSPYQGEREFYRMSGW